MKKRDEVAYFNKEWKEMKAGLKAFLTQETQEDLHRFRVQVKKLRSFLILADSNGNHTKLTKHFKPVRKAFKQAGDIRNPYVNLELAKEYHIDSDTFVSAQQQLMEKATTEIKLNGDAHLKEIKAAHKLIERGIKPISNLHIDFYYKNQLQQIAAGLNPLKFDDTLHECRTLVKILIYNYKLTHIALETSFNEDYLEQVQTAIGDWHDHTLAMELFSGEELKGKIDTAQLKKQHLKLKNNIKKLIKDFYNQATTVAELPVEQLS